MDQLQILAKVNGQPITSAEVDAALIQMGANGQRYNNPEGRRMVLDQIINKKLFLADAAKNLYEYDPKFKAEFQKLKEEMLANFAIAKAVEGVKVTDDEAKAFFEENKGELVSGETVNASHILVDSEEKALEIMDSITKGDVVFEEAAKEFSSCPSNAQGG
ncbi:MAG: peptidylprolyl isomerase, partial [Clostridia bacterium]|nr:peptidylprolyl isomerase [Clostridia bacterium]